MKLSVWLSSLAMVIGSANTLAATTPLSNFLGCTDQSFPVVTQAPFDKLISSVVENGRITLKAGTKSDMGQRWMFDKPVTVNGLVVTGFFAEDMDIKGSRIINWGFYSQQTPGQIAALLKTTGVDLPVAGEVLARPEIWSEQHATWQLETSDATAGKLVADTSERVLMVEPAPEDVAGSHGMLTCSLQGKVSQAALKSSRPDLLAR
ncbi:hypothetical protein [Pseudomonas sp. RIT-PI-S]|uniref:hypothetical protein n=1 Tax=Pseudomonas sp. RIT-PI-S TaxID=3035295 RepID=UPI0021DA4444|nr:hypothetical protein [Pseudomonas sp. RIT-PI-S]